MAETSGFFNAEEKADGTYDREYFAQQFAHYFALFIGNGVFYDSSERLQVVQDQSMSMMVDLLPGNAFINGYWYSNGPDALVLQVPVADSVQPRIDSVVLQWTTMTRDITAKVKTGIPAANPQPPALIRTDTIYELELARISLARAQVGITTASIQDMRLNDAVCGIVQGVVQQVDLTTLFNQFTQWYNDFTSAADAEFTEWDQDFRDDADDRLDQIMDAIDAMADTNGPWDPLVSYKRYSIVTVSSSDGTDAYIALNQVPAGVQPPDPTYWAPATIRGEPGRDGVVVEASGKYAFQIEGDNLYLYYDEDETPPDFEIDTSGHLIYTFPTATGGV